MYNLYDIVEYFFQGVYRGAEYELLNIKNNIAHCVQNLYMYLQNTYLQHYVINMYV